MNLLPLADAFTALFVGLPIFVIVLIILGSIFWLWMLIDAIVNPRLRDTEKLIWILVVFFLHFIGALIYFFVGRNGGATGGSPAV